MHFYHLTCGKITANPCIVDLETDWRGEKKMAIVVLWFLAALLCAFVAAQKNRSSFAWFLVAIFLTPVIALLALCAVPVALRPVGATQTRPLPIPRAHKKYGVIY